MDEIKAIVTDIKNKNFKPVYFLMGEEPYFIDKISNFIENNVLNEEERGFNQTVMYGKDVTVEELIMACKRFPMMSEHQVIVVKEAQHLSRTIDKLSPYLENPQKTTILVLNYKYKTLDKRKKITKIIAKKGLLFESKKMYESQLYSWTVRFLKRKKYGIEPKASQMLVEFLGTDLSKISNELDKLISILPEKTIISPEHIEQSIGISKDFNNFELRKALGQKNVLRSNQIINYFVQNPKDNPLVVTISLLNSFFTQLLLYHGQKDKSKMVLAKVLGVSPYFIDDYIHAANNYPMRKVSRIISLIREADVKSKGVASNQSHRDILKELIFKILH